jgi:hypothetical protein
VECRAQQDRLALLVLLEQDRQERLGLLALKAQLEQPATLAQLEQEARELQEYKA